MLPVSLGVHFALLDCDQQRPFVRFKTNVAPYCVRGGVRVVSIGAYLLHHPACERYAPDVRSAPPGHASIQLILDHYSHWMQSMDGASPTGWTKHWARRPTLVLSFPSVVARVHAATARRGQAAESPLPRLLRRCSTHPGLSLRAA